MHEQLWRKAWMETRWRFLTGLAVLLLSAAATVAAYPAVRDLVSRVPDAHEALGPRAAEAARLAATFRGYIWAEWFLRNLPLLWSLFAVLLGTGGLVAQASRGALFTLSLPVSRRTVIGIRVGTSLIELLLLAVVPSMGVVVLASTVGESHGISEALIHALCVFAGGLPFFGLAVLLSSAFADVWRPILIGVCAVFVASLAEDVLGRLGGSGLFRLMSAEEYFVQGAVPWLNLLAGLLTGAALIWLGILNAVRRDF